MKQRFDRGRRARPPALKLGDSVRIRRPNRSHKLLSFWSASRQITAQLGSATYRFADGSRWHTSRLRKVAPPFDFDQAAAVGWHHAEVDWGVEVPAAHPPEPAWTSSHWGPPEAILPQGLCDILVSAKPVTWQNNPQGYAGKLVVHPI